MPGRGHQHQVGGIEQQDTGSVDLEFSRHLLSYDAKCFVKAQPAGDCAIDSPLGREAVQPSLGLGIEPRVLHRHPDLIGEQQ